MKLFIAALSAFMAAVTSAQAAPSGDYLYRVTMVRAAPGSLADLLAYYAELKSSGYYDRAGERAPFIMRHSQGDHWDLLILSPMEDFGAYHQSRRTRLRDKAAQEAKAVLDRRGGLVAFSEDLFARGPNVSEIADAFAANGLFHIEMFNAAPGKADALFGQREMENAYLAATGQTTNTIFKVEAGGDVDVFTIGFHKSLAAFAAESPATADEREAAAKAAGFQNRADISFYLRSLISSHHDTLATKVE